MIVLSNVLLSLRRLAFVSSWMELNDPSVVNLFNFEAASSCPY